MAEQRKPLSEVLLKEWKHLQAAEQTLYALCERHGLHRMEWWNQVRILCGMDEDSEVRVDGETKEAVWNDTKSCLTTHEP